jgi:antitoxin HicB
MENIYKLPLVLDPQPEDGWTITCPILPGQITEADTLDEVSANVTDALEALIEGYEELNQPLRNIWHIGRSIARSTVGLYFRYLTSRHFG